MNHKKVLKIFVFSTIFFGLCFLFSDKKVNSVTYITDTQKQIIRDTKRLSDLTKLKNAIEQYKNTNGYYPKLASDTYIKGYVNSSWVDSWNNFCNTIGLGSDCPVDPINEISNCNCNLFGSSCNATDLNTDQCYNSKLNKFICTRGSHIYQYQSLNNGKNYALYMDFEYTQGAGYGNYFRVNSNENNNIIDVDDNCIAVGAEYKIISGGSSVCGNKIVESGEFCDGNDKIEFCTNTSGVRGRIVVPCTNACVYQPISLDNNPNCKTEAFCGDSIIETGEECDNNSEELCSKNYGMHAWYKEQVRHCQDNCKYDKGSTVDLKNCGGYCGDNIVQSQEECDIGIEYLKWNGIAFKQCSSYTTQSVCEGASCLWNGSSCVDKKCINYNTSNCPSDKCNVVGGSCIPKPSNLYNDHCGVRGGIPCKYQNTPAIFSSSFSLDSRSYFKQGNGFQYSDRVPANFTTGKIDVAKDSLFFEIRINGVKDLDGDSIKYKFDFNEATNSDIGFFKSDINSGDLSLVSNKPEEITGKWVDLPIDSNGYGVIRIYSTETDKDNNDKIKLIDGSYFGDYSFTVSIKDTWDGGANTTGNQQGVASSKSFNFYIGSTCGDFTLQSVNDDGQHEYCEYKPYGAKYTNFADNEPSMTQSSGKTQYCIALKTGDGWFGRWDDEYCDNIGYGICEKAYNAGCGSGWIANNTSFCYKITNTQDTWDNVRAFCKNAGGDLFVFKNSSENDFVASLFPSGSAVWIGYYNLNKIRTGSLALLIQASNGSAVDKSSLIIPVNENGNSRINVDNIYDGGKGINYSNQYMCSKACTDIGGYCGDGYLENGYQQYISSFGLEYTNRGQNKYYYYISNFEQCDPSTNNGKIQTGSGTSVDDQYSCDNCMFSGGYCGDTIINYDGDSSANENQDSGIGQGIDPEHCDPTHKLLPEESGNIQGQRGYGASGYGANYICWDSYDNIPSASNNFGNSSTNSPWIPYKSDGTTQVGDLAYFLAHRDEAKIFKVNNNGVCQKSYGGYCGDGIIQLSYNQMDANSRINKKYTFPIYSSLNVYNKNNTSYDKNSPYFQGYGYKEDNTFTQDMKIEECDPNYFVYPNESNNLTSGFFYTMYTGDTSHNFNGQSRLTYYCNKEANNKCNMNYSVSLDSENKTRASISLSGGLKFGYCGDGIISSYGYGSNFLVSYGITSLNNSNREECDPKDHIVGYNGYGYGNNTIAGYNNTWFGCRQPNSSGSIVYGSNCSSYVTPATSSSTNTYQCSYDCKNGGGYCGDGTLQSDFFEECDYNNSSYNSSSYGMISLYNNKTGTGATVNYLCGKSLSSYGGYFDPEFAYGANNKIIDKVNGIDIFSSGKVMQNNLLACRTFGGYLGDGMIQACLIGGNGYGTSNWSRCYTYNSGTRSYSPVSGTTSLEFCDPNDSDGWYATYGYGCNNTGTGCKPGFYINSSGVCSLCDTGHACPGGGHVMDICPKGTYQNQVGQTSCIACPDGKYSSSEGATQCLDCPGGYPDNDGDGHGISSKDVPWDNKCNKTTGGFSVPHVSSNDDCNDYNNAIHPGAPEVCDNTDSNCDDNYFDGCQTAWIYAMYVDAFFNGAKFSSGHVCIADPTNLVCTDHCYTDNPITTANGSNILTEDGPGIVNSNRVFCYKNILTNLGSGGLGSIHCDSFAGGSYGSILDWDAVHEGFGEYTVYSINMDSQKLYAFDKDTRTFEDHIPGGLYYANCCPANYYGSYNSKYYSDFSDCHPRSGAAECTSN